MARVKERLELDFSGATLEYARALELSPNNADVLLRSGMFDMDQGRHARGVTAMNRALALDPLNIRSLNYAAYQMAEVYALRGDSPKALDWLDTAYRLRDAGFSQLHTDRWLDALRPEPRFRTIERKLYPEIS